MRNSKIRLPRQRRGRRSEKGYALISVIFAASLVLLTLLMVMTVAQLGTKILVTQLTYQGQALNAANAGLIEGQDWFLRQTQPVMTFVPVRNMSATPLPIDDTDIVTTPPSINRDFLISAPGRIWGHYELTQGTAGGTTGVLDLSDNRKGTVATDGSIWQLESTGIIYVKNGSGAYNVSPNKVLARRTVRTEISRMALNIPLAAVSMAGTLPAALPVASAATFGTAANDNVRVVGGPGAYGLQSNGIYTVNGAATLSGNAGQRNLAAPNLSISGVFGLQSTSDIAAIANISVGNESSLPSPLPAMQLIYINRGSGNTVVFNASNPLRGSGILVINGNLSIAGLSQWNGVIYVMGNYTQSDPATVSGAIMVTNAGSVSITGTSDYAEVYYDPYIISQIRQQIGVFRMSRRPYIPCLANDPLCTSRLSGNRDTGF